MAHLVPFDLTFVRYQDNDKLGELLACKYELQKVVNHCLTSIYFSSFKTIVITLTPIFVMVMYATILMIRRDFQTGFICAGQLANVALNLVLKKIIAQPRPEAR